MRSQIQPAPRLTDHWLRLARVLVLAWILLTVLFLSLALLEKYQSRHTLKPGIDSGFAFYGWTAEQLQMAAAELGLQPEMVTGTMFASSLATLACFLGIGGLLFWRKSDTWVGLLGAYTLISTGPGFSALLLTQTQIPPWAKDLYSFSAMFIWPTLFISLYLFPSGKFVPRFSRYLAVGPYLLFALVWFFPNSSLMESAGPWVLIAYAIGGLISQVYRYRKVSTPSERQQTKWVVFALGILIGILLIQSVVWLFPALSVRTPASFLYEWIGNGIVGILAPALIPLAIGISILRYRLWDIDILIRRTLQYSLLSGLLALTYFGGIVVLQGMFTAVSGSFGFAQDSPLVTVLSTLAIAGLFLPLRRRVQDFIDRRFYRKKYDAAKVIADFAATCRDETDLDKLTARLVEVVDETMQPESVQLWLKPTADNALVSGQLSAVTTQGVKHDR